MKPVKMTAVSSLFAMLLACPLAACTAEVGPGEPEPTMVRTVTPGPGGGGGGNAGNQHAVGTTGRTGGGEITPWKEPLPNPWHDGPGGGIPSEGIMPDVASPDDIPVLPSPRPTVHRAVDDPGVERYNGGSGKNAF